MCLAVPGRVESIAEEGPFRMAEVDFCGVRRKVAVDTVDVEPGQYVIAHAGVAISVMDPEEALQTIDDLKRMADERDAHA